MRDIVSAVGRGRKLARDLTGEEAATAMRFLMEGKASPYQVGAFLIAMRVKGETAEELAGLTRVARDYGAELAVGELDFLVDIPVYAGKRKTFHTVPCYALVMAAAGVQVVMHGCGSRAGKTAAESVLVAAGATGRLCAASAAQMLAQTGFAYVDIRELNPLLYDYLDLRNEFGVRTVVNTILRIYDPAGGGRHLIGVTHPRYLERLAKAMELLGGARALLFRGVEGEPELALRARLSMTEVRAGKVKQLSCELEELGLEPAAGKDLSAGDPAEQARLMRDILSRELTGSYLDAVLLNAGCGIYVSGRVESLPEGVELARESIQSGSALRKFHTVVQAWQEMM